MTTEIPFSSWQRIETRQPPLDRNLLFHFKDVRNTATLLRLRYAKLQWRSALSCADWGDDKEVSMFRERALEDRVGGGGIVVYGGSCSANNLFLARARGANDNEYLCHTRNFLAAGGV